MKKNYSGFLVISLAVLSLVLGVTLIIMQFQPEDNPKTPGCQLDRVHNVPPSGPITINGKRPFVLTLVNKNTTAAVTVNVTIIGQNNTIVVPYQIPAATETSSGIEGYYKGVVIDTNLGGIITGTNFEYKIDLTQGNAGLSNVYAIYSDTTVIIP